MASAIIFQNNFHLQKTEEASKELPKRKSNFSYPIERLLLKYQESLTFKSRGEVSTIHVDEIASKVAHFYEKVRKIVDWKEENLLRRNAVERILKRSLITQISQMGFIFKVDVGQIAEPLVLELIRGGHLPNDQIPVEKIAEVKEVLKKYHSFLKNASFPENGSRIVIKKKINFYEWILEIAACELEEVLAPPIRENALIESMTVLMHERIKIIPEGKISEQEKIIQTYIAVHRTLFDLDDSIITYHLLKYHYSQWTKPDEPFLKEITQNIYSIWERIEGELKHPVGREFFNLCERTDTVFTLLDDVLQSYKNEPEKIFEGISNRENFKELITQFYNKRLASLKSRLFKLAVFSTLSVFVSNWFTYVIVEVPLAKLFYEGFSLLAAVIDFFLPTMAMFVLVAIIKPPSSSNLNKVVKLIFDFVYPGEEKVIYEIKLQKRGRPLTKLIIALLYLITCIFSLTAIAWIFYRFGLPMTSVIFDTLSEAINIFAALAIRNKAKEITVEEKTSFWEFFLDILSLPVGQVGSWLSSKWKEYNIVSVFFNVVIETPFISFIEFIEDWRGFLKERKAEFH